MPHKQCKSKTLTFSHSWWKLTLEGEDPFALAPKTKTCKAPVPLGNKDATLSKSGQGKGETQSRGAAISKLRSQDSSWNNAVRSKAFFHFFPQRY